MFDGYVHATVEQTLAAAQYQSAPWTLLRSPAIPAAGGQQAGAGTPPVTESVAQRTLALPFHNNLSEEQVGYVCETLKAVYHKDADEFLTPSRKGNI